MADNKIVVFDFTGVRFHDSHTGISSELLTVGYQYADAIEGVVYRLRRKLQAAPVELVTLRGLGYLLRSAA